LSDFSPRASSAVGTAKETKFGTTVAYIYIGDEDNAPTSNRPTAQRKRAIPHSTMRNMTSVTLDDDK